MNTQKALIRQIMLNGGTIVVVALMLLVQRAWAGPAAQGATPGVMSYQGYLTNKDGQPVNTPEGQKGIGMTFRLYAQPSGGTALWNEAHTGANAVPVTNGLFNVLLGSLQPIPSTVWDSPDLHLEVQVGSEKMTPREQVGRVPYAMAASRALTADSATTATQLSAPDGDPAAAVYVDKSGTVHVNGDYYGKGHMWLYAFEGDGQDGTAYIQARDDSKASNIDLQFRTQKGRETRNVMRLTSDYNVDMTAANITANGQPLVMIRRVTVIDKLDTRIPFPDWNCVAASWVVHLDIDEYSTQWHGAWTYLYGTNPITWWVFADLSSKGKKSVDVDILCFRKEITQLQGKFYGPPWEH